jgi:hypothetical protein
MPEVQIKLSALWVALMLTYLLGDFLRFWSGDATPGAFGGLKPDMVPVALFGVALLMLIPIVMVVASVTLTGQTLHWISVPRRGGRTRGTSRRRSRASRA